MCADGAQFEGARTRCSFGYFGAWPRGNLPTLLSENTFLFLRVPGSEAHRVPGPSPVLPEAEPRGTLTRPGTSHSARPLCLQEAVSCLCLGVALPWGLCPSGGSAWGCSAWGLCPGVAPALGALAQGLCLGLCLGGSAQGVRPALVLPIWLLTPPPVCFQVSIQIQQIFTEN